MKLPPEFNEKCRVEYANAEAYLATERVRDEKKEMIQQYKVTLRTFGLSDGEIEVFERNARAAHPQIGSLKKRLNV